MDKKIRETSDSYFRNRLFDPFEEAKGQIISKWFFGVFDFLQKTNENKSTWGIIVVKSNSFVRFLEEIEDTKNHFEIIWPLVTILKALLSLSVTWSFQSLSVLPAVHRTVAF